MSKAVEELRRVVEEARTTNNLGVAMVYPVCSISDIIRKCAAICEEADIPWLARRIESALNQEADDGD